MGFDGGCYDSSSHPSGMSKHLANWFGHDLIAQSPSGLTLDPHQAQIAQWDRLDVPNGGGQNEAINFVIRAVNRRICGRKQ